MQRQVVVVGVVCIAWRWRAEQKMMVRGSTRPRGRGKERRRTRPGEEEEARPPRPQTALLSVNPPSSPHWILSRISRQSVLQVRGIPSRRWARCYVWQVEASCQDTSGGPSPQRRRHCTAIFAGPLRRRVLTGLGKWKDDRARSRAPLSPAMLLRAPAARQAASQEHILESTLSRVFKQEIY